MKKTTHIGVYALIQKKNELLFIKKSRGPYAGKWDLPGGGLEFGEKPEVALKREVQEEVGLAVSHHELLDVFSCVVTYKNVDNEQEMIYHVGMVFRVEVDFSEKNKSSPDGEDSLGSKWLLISRINKNDFSPFASQVQWYANI